VKSALYAGTVTHRRHATEATGQVAHSFHYPITLPLLFLDEIDEVIAMHPRWSRRGVDAVWFRRRDYVDCSVRPLDEAVRDAVEARSGRRPEGDIAQLGHLRRWGWLFNPICVYYCFDAAGHVDQLLLEVRNTPWHERHLYALDARTSPQRFAKEMHVSPFLGMDHEYVLTFSEPGEHLALHLGNRRGEERVFDAGMSLERREITRASLGDLAWRHPFATLGVSAGIYYEALRLFAKHAPFHGHPRRGRAETREDLGV